MRLQNKPVWLQMRWAAQFCASHTKQAVAMFGRLHVCGLEQLLFKCLFRGELLGAHLPLVGSYLISCGICISSKHRGKSKRLLINVMLLFSHPFFWPILKLLFVASVLWTGSDEATLQSSSYIARSSAAQKGAWSVSESQNRIKLTPGNACPFHVQFTPNSCPIHLWQHGWVLL